MVKEMVAAQRLPQAPKYVAIEHAFDYSGRVEQTLECVEQKGVPMAEQHHEKTYRVVVNGVESTVDHDLLTYDEVVRLGFPSPDPNTIYSVSFEKAREPKEGELLPGQSVEIKENTEFDVDDTGRS